MTSSSDGRALHGTTMDIPYPAASAGLPPNPKVHHYAAAAGLQMPTERDSSHDSMVSSTSNLPSSYETQGSDAASVLLYQSSNSGKDPRLWNVQEVTNFMYSIGCSNYADAFVKEVCFSCLNLIVSPRARAGHERMNNHQNALRESLVIWATLVIVSGSFCHIFGQNGTLCAKTR